MKFRAFIRLILVFYNMAVKHADVVSGYSPGNSVQMMLRNGTLYIVTGTTPGETLSGSLSNDTLTLNLTSNP